MSLKRANVPFSFGYAAYDQNTGLFIRAHVFNTTSGAPIAITTVNLVHDGFGCYTGHAMGGNDQESYSVDMLVYTDGTYTTIDPDRSPAKADFDFISLATAQDIMSPIADFTATVLDELEMLATIDADSELMAFGVSEEELSAVLQDEELLAQIETDEIQIAMMEC